MIKRITLLSIMIFKIMLAGADNCPDPSLISCNSQTCTSTDQNFSIVRYIKPSSSDYTVSFYASTGSCSDETCKINNQISYIYCEYWVGSGASSGMITFNWKKTNYIHNYVDTNLWKVSNNWLNCYASATQCYWQPNTKMMAS